MIRRALLATILGLAAVTAVTTGPAQARACQLSYTCVTTYYSDSAHTTVVGGKFEDCEGNTSTWGVRTGYLTFDESPC
ncbi:hypothetical protein GCM10022224_007000 [Nonomuraea antimicrobica]|uniref:Peptidase inhibitor family I36 n=1 Tax=Nonomuraea antimicrobica TaxID=561173 RepID=A0ABP7B379_9ACTN